MYAMPFTTITVLAVSSIAFAKPYRGWFDGRECDEPVIESERHCGGARIVRYFFNRTAGECVRFYWNGCMYNGVFDTMIRCVDTCNVDQEPGLCQQEKDGPCETKTGEVSPMPHYYYDIISETCKEYTTCSVLDDFIVKNNFPSKTLCTMQCVGFSWRHTKEGKQQIQTRSLLQMLDTDQKIWIYRSSHQHTLNDKEVSCDCYKADHLGPSTRSFDSQYDYKFTYEYVAEDMTHQAIHQGKIGKENDKEIMEVSIGEHRYELHVWEQMLFNTYQFNQEYSGCKSEIEKYCKKFHKKRFRKECPNVYIINKVGSG
ncbi:papilin isoform X2 [Rhipicephalus sanguineus]|uniref:papilin isoform X2 n=1 Tax=Rhipicephalus sanguineus TaxID=34632 RepID=UPI00189364BD|nr:papilin isoform X2 [Rhipicephalus sanguineus]